MRLADRILALIPIAGTPLRALRAQFPDIAPVRLDAALVGLRSAQRIGILGGMVSLPGIPQPACVPMPSEKRLRARAAMTKWRRENHELALAQKRRWAARRKAANQEGIT